MISVTEAKQKIIDNTGVLTPVLSKLGNAVGKVLAEDVYSTTDIPAFNQSSMDGYAFSFQKWASDNRPLKITGEIAAGAKDLISLEPGNAVRIFTGGTVPEGADTVVMQEKISIQDEHLVIDDKAISQGLNVRLKGSEIKTGQLAMAKNSLLTPAAIGFLAGVGVDVIPVYPYPSVSIIVTGNELQQPGNLLLAGQLYESNSFSLQAALHLLQITDVKIYYAEDNLEKITRVLNESFYKTDVIFLTGGISVGDYDFVLQAATACGVEKIFHRVKQRPGRPLYFGKKANKLVFGLPGNPASVLTCFYEYAEAALKQMARQQSSIQIMSVPLAEPFKKATGLTHFLKGYFDGKKVTALHAQESYRLSSFAHANCLIKIDEEVISCYKDEMVEIHLLSF